MDIFKKMGITVGQNAPLIQELINKSEQDKEIAHNNIIRKGAGLSPRDVLEQQLAKGGITIRPMTDDEMADSEEKQKAKAINPHLKGSHGEEFHSDNDKQVEKMVTEGEVIQSEFDCEKPMKVEFSKSEGSEYKPSRPSGEGSRGGKVIGHTKSGKPIYDNANHPSHANFSKEDHGDAYREHNKMVGKLYALYGSGISKEGDEKIKHHSDQSKEHYKQSEVPSQDAKIKRMVAMPGQNKHPFGKPKSMKSMSVLDALSDIVKSDKQVSNKISKLVREEKKPQKQAVAIALDMERRGKLGKSEEVEMPKKKFVQEHKKLVNVLESPSHEDDKKEAKEQKKELKEIDKGGRCWDGYKPVPGKKPYSEDSCEKKAYSCKSLNDAMDTLDSIIKGGPVLSTRVPKHAPKPEKSKYEKRVERQLVREQMGKSELPEGVSKKEYNKIASLHENSEGVAEKRKAVPFLKSAGPGGLIFDFGVKTGNALADNATAILNQNADPVQQANANYNANAYSKALESYVTKGEQAYMQEATPYGNVDKEWSKQLNTPMDTQVKEAFEKGQLSDNNSKPAVVNDFNKTEMTLGGQVIKATSETDAALIEMMRNSLAQDDGTGLVAEIGGGEGRVAEIS